MGRQVTAGGPMDRIHLVTRDCFNALVQLRQLDEGSLPSVDALHAQLRRFVDALLQKAAQAGFSREDANDLAYPVVALADEIVMGKSEALRERWASRSLQLHFFDENVAGEAFFTRLEALRRDARGAEIVRAYHLALLFGFQGRYKVRGGDLELLSLVEDLERELGRGRRADDEALSPRGDRPAEALSRRAARSPLLWVALGLVVVAVLGYVGLRVAVGSQADAVVARIAAANLP